MTHPFHPLHGREFPLVTRRENWGEARAYFYDDQGALRSIPVAWTSLAPDDPFCLLAAGRAALRTEDLLALLRLVQQLRHRPEASA